jgi:signal transduction histidine kinase
VTAIILRKWHNSLFILVIVSLLVPVGWIVGRELTRHLEERRNFAREYVRILTEHAAAHLDDVNTESPGQPISEQTVHPYQQYGMFNIDLIVLYDHVGRVLFVWTENNSRDVTTISDIPLLHGLAPQWLLRTGSQTVESDRVIGAAAEVSGHPYRYFVGYDRRQIFQKWSLRAMSVMLVMGVLVTVILSMNQAIHREVYNRFRAEEERTHQGLRYLESLRVLAGGLAHRVNNQMTVIIGNVDILLDEVEQPTRVQRFTTAIRNAAREASDLSTRMLATAGNAAIYREPYRLKTLLEALRAAVLRETENGYSLNTALDAAERNITVEVDLELMKIAVIGLVTNSVESYSDITDTPDPMAITLGVAVIQWNPNQQKPVIPIRYSACLAPGRYIGVSVEDAGRGIPEETMTHLFEPFFTTGFLGRGLGLSAVAGIAAEHGGAVMVQSPQGVGTTVTVMIPLSPEESEGP